MRPPFRQPPLPSSKAKPNQLAAFTFTADFSVFVGDLAPDVTDYVLQETFRQYYPSVRSAKVSMQGPPQQSRSQ